MAQRSQPTTSPPSLWRLTLYFLRLGTFGFGGPIALAGSMQRDLVENRHWISEQDYVEGLALAQLAPGPLAAQLAMYLGLVAGGWVGATLIGLAFILPSFLMVLAIAFAYTRLGGLPWMQAMFYGVGAALIAILVRAARKLTRSILRKDLLLWSIAVVLALSTVITEREIVWLFLGGGLLSMLVKAPLLRLKFPQVAPMLLPGGLSFTSHRFWEVLAFFAKAGLFVFGSGLAIVPFLHGGVVLERHWLDERQFLDAVAVAMITPGPVVITVAFIGFLVAGLAGAVAAGLGVFLPVYLVVIFVGPHFKRIQKKAELRAFVQGVTAAATGAIAGAVIVLGRRSIHDTPTAIVFAVSLLVLANWRIPEPVLILAAAVAGELLSR